MRTFPSESTTTPFDWAGILGAQSVVDSVVTELLVYLGCPRTMLLKSTQGWYSRASPGHNVRSLRGEAAKERI